jgi:hypothetical protein
MTPIHIRHELALVGELPTGRDHALAIYNRQIRGFEQRRDISEEPRSSPRVEKGPIGSTIHTQIPAKRYRVRGQLFVHCRGYEPGIDFVFIP